MTSYSRCNMVIHKDNLPLIIGKDDKDDEAVLEKWDAGVLRDRLFTTVHGDLALISFLTIHLPSPKEFIEAVKDRECPFIYVEVTSEWQCVIDEWVPKQKANIGDASLLFSKIDYGDKRPGEWEMVYKEDTNWEVLEAMAAANMKGVPLEDIFS